MLKVVEFRIMVSTCKRNTQRGSWSSEAMERAVEAVRNEGFGCIKAAAEFGVPQSTLERRVRERKKGVVSKARKKVPLKKKLGPYKTVFTLQEEQKLATYIKEMKSQHFELTCYDLRKLAFQLAEKYHLKHNFSTETELAGKDWLSSFLKRNPDLDIKMSAPTAAEKAASFNRLAVYNFFFLLAEVLDKHQIKSSRIYNTGEIGITIIPEAKSKVVSFRDRRQEDVLTLAEKGYTITAEICFSATGRFIPPMLIYPLGKKNPEILGSKMGGVWAECHKSGWMQDDIFFSWFQRFVELSKATKEAPVLLLLDGYFTHTKNINLVDYARNNGVILLCFPSHCAHRLQALDVAFIEPLCTNYDSAFSTWLKNNPGKEITLCQITKLFVKAYIKTATKPRAIQGFQKTGIWPYNPDVFDVAEFVPLEIHPESVSAVIKEESPTKVARLKENTCDKLEAYAEPLNLKMTTPSAGPSTSDFGNFSSLDIFPVERVVQKPIFKISGPKYKLN